MALTAIYQELTPVTFPWARTVEAPMAETEMILETRMLLVR